jgi:ribosome-associated toxin RatA of RatAB toxin-antitoxin module
MHNTKSLTSNAIALFAFSASLREIMVLLLFVVHFLLPSAGYAAECTDACQVPAASANEPTITEEKAANGKTAVKAVFFVPGEPDLVYGILKDASRFPEFMPDTLEARIIESAEDYHVADFRGSNGLIQSRFVMRRIFADQERRISWTQVEGNARDVKGSWVVQAENGGSVVTYWSVVDAGALVPDALVRAYQKESIPPMVANLRLRVESGGTWKSEAYLKNKAF